VIRKVDSLREEQWVKLVAMHQKQIQLLSRLVEDRT